MQTIGEYRGPLRRAILRLKQVGDGALVSDLGGRLAEVAGPPGLWDLVAGVPTSARRRRWRGYCGPESLARVVGKKLGLPVLSELSCVGDPAPRKSLKTLATRRSDAVQFCCRRRLPGASVLLIDDVVTSGQTLTQARLALLEAGAQKVDLLCLARSAEARSGRSAS